MLEIIKNKRRFYRLLNRFGFYSGLPHVFDEEHKTFRYNNGEKKFNFRSRFGVDHYYRVVVSENSFTLEEVGEYGDYSYILKTNDYEMIFRHLARSFIVLEKPIYNSNEKGVYTKEYFAKMGINLD